MLKTVHGTIQIALNCDTDLKATFVAFQPVCNALSTVGTDRTDFWVAIKETGKVFSQSGVSCKVWKTKHRKKVARPQRKLVERGQLMFFCFHCDTIFHADINAAWDILCRGKGLLLLRCVGTVGCLSVVPEARHSLHGMGKGRSDKQRSFRLTDNLCVD